MLKLVKLRNATGMFIYQWKTEFND